MSFEDLKLIEARVNQALADQDQFTAMFVLTTDVPFLLAKVREMERLDRDVARILLLNRVDELMASVAKLREALTSCDCSCVDTNPLQIKICLRCKTLAEVKP